MNPQSILAHLQDRKKRGVATEREEAALSWLDPSKSFIDCVNERKAELERQHGRQHANATPNPFRHGGSQGKSAMKDERKIELYLPKHHLDLSKTWHLISCPPGIVRWFYGTAEEARLEQAREMRNTGLFILACVAAVAVGMLVAWIGGWL